MHRSISSTPPFIWRTFAAAIILISAFLLLGGSTLGCSGASLRVESATAEGLADVANLGLPVISAAYEQAVTDAIRNAATQEDAAAAREHRPSQRGPAMDSAEAAIVLHWAPLWSTWAVFRASHDAWATAIETGNSNGNEFAQVKAAYCALKIVAPASVKSIVDNVSALVCPPVVTEGPVAAPDAWRSPDGGPIGQSVTKVPSSPVNGSK